CLKEQTQLYLGLFEREIYFWLHRSSDCIATAIDIGAAQGEYTLFFLKKTAAIKVYSFEPDSNAVFCLEKNVSLNGLYGSERLQLSSRLVGLVDCDGETCLDSLLPSLSFPCLVKVDTDGAEVKILEGAKSLNSLSGVRWLIETHSPELEA